MHELDYAHFHPASEREAEFIRDTIWKADNVELTTVGVDVGSSTSHLMFARVHLQRLSEALSSRFVVVDRDVLWRSPILLTPYRPDYTIDADALKSFFDGAFREAGLTPDDIDSGAVILTGEALKRVNARAIADLFAEETGKFVCASAGHNLESVMAAHGSGAVKLSKAEDKVFLNVDIGGGTTKFALCQGARSSRRRRSRSAGGSSPMTATARWCGSRGRRCRSRRMPAFRSSPAPRWRPATGGRWCGAWSTYWWARSARKRRTLSPATSWSRRRSTPRPGPT